MAERRTFTIRGLLVLIACIAAVMAFLLPWLVKAREVARRMSCSNNLKQIGLSLHNYHSAYKILPSAMGGTPAPAGPTSGNANRLSGLIGLTAFLEASPLHSQISNSWQVGDTTYPPFGPVPWDANYPPWQLQTPTLQCPSDASPKEVFGRTNYAFSVGDLVENLHAPASMDNVRGMFAPGHQTRFRDVHDSLFSTIMMTEIATKRSDYVAGQFVVDVPREQLSVPDDCLKFVDPNRPLHYDSSAKLSDLGRGGNWADGAGGYSLVHIILPPNSPSVAIDGTAQVDGIFSASSRHPGGCHVLFADGAVLFITNSCEAGDPSEKPPVSVKDSSGRRITSPYGLWGAMGTRASSEWID